MEHVGVSLFVFIGSRSTSNSPFTAKFQELSGTRLRPTAVSDHVQQGLRQELKATGTDADVADKVFVRVVYSDEVNRLARVRIGFCVLFTATGFENAFQSIRQRASLSSGRSSRPAQNFPLNID